MTRWLQKYEKTYYTLMIKVKVKLLDEKYVPYLATFMYFSLNLIFIKVQLIVEYLKIFISLQKDNIK